MRIGVEMNSVTAALPLGGDNDSRMQVSIDAVYLPTKMAATVLIPFGRRDPRVQILFTDIRMLATEYGVDLDNIPTDHPNAGEFKPLRPYEGKQYDLVLCDG